jgi:hypothetical protein
MFSVDLTEAELRELYAPIHVPTRWVHSLGASGVKVRPQQVA